MATIEHNQPNTRARVAARRQARKAERQARPGRKRTGPRSTRQPAVPFSMPAGQPLRVPHGVRTLLGQSKLHQARSKARARPGSQGSSQVRPGVRRRLAGWFASGQLVSGMVFVATIAVLAYILTAPEFRVQQIVVEGNALLVDEQVVQLAHLQAHPIWFVDHASAVERLLENAYVEQAQVALRLPDQATITIVERQPEVRWQVGGVHYLVDGTGRVLDTASAPPEPGTLIIEANTPGMLHPNEYVDRDALELARLLTLRLPNELDMTPTTIGWDYGMGVYILTGAGQTVVFGRAEYLDRKLAVLRALRDDQTAFTYLDLRPSNPFYH